MHEHEGFFCANDLYFRIAQDNFFNAGTMVRFHMVNYHVIQWTALKNVFDIFQELTAYSPVYCIEEDSRFIQQHVGIIGYALRDGVNIFKQVQAVVIGAYPK